MTEKEWQWTLLLTGIPLAVGVALGANGVLLLSQGSTRGEAVLVVAGFLSIGMGVIAALLSFAEYRNRIAIEIATTIVALGVLTATFVVGGFLDVGLLSSETVFVVASYAVLGYILFDRVVLRSQRGRFVADDRGFRPPSVPLLRLIRRKAFVRYEEVAEAIVRSEPEGPRVLYVRLRDGNILMLREADGVPQEFMERITSTFSPGRDRRVA